MLQCYPFLYLLCISCPMDLQCPIKAVTINQSINALRSERPFMILFIIANVGSRWSWSCQPGNNLVACSMSHATPVPCPACPRSAQPSPTLPRTTPHLHIENAGITDVHGQVLILAIHHLRLAQQGVVGKGRRLPVPAGAVAAALKSVGGTGSSRSFGGKREFGWVGWRYRFSWVRWP